MAHIIDPKECTTCAACEAECPNGAVQLHQNEQYFVIDPATCTDCGDCVGVCPTDAIAIKPPA
jgi:NAD-dependent dihydropyrimidine dehydrogenase PreA subunit